MSDRRGEASPPDALRTLAALLGDERTPVSEHVVEPREAPALGLFVAAGPRAAQAPAEYALVVESIREGYLLHYGASRLLAGQDPDLALLAGDYLYALGLERLAALGDDEAVRELSDLISLCAVCHAEGTQELVPALWLAVSAAVACGGGEGHASALAAARAAASQAEQALRESAHALATQAGIETDLEGAAESIDLPVGRAADLG